LTFQEQLIMKLSFILLVFCLVLSAFAAKDVKECAPDACLRPNEQSVLYQNGSLKANPSMVPVMEKKWEMSLSKLPANYKFGASEQTEPSKVTIKIMKAFKKLETKLSSRFKTKKDGKIRTFLKSRQSKLLAYLERALNNPVVARRLEGLVRRQHSSLKMIFSEEQIKLFVARLPENINDPKNKDLIARGKRLVKRDGVNSLTAVVIISMASTESVVAIILLALLVLPITIALDLVGIVIGLALLVGIGIPFGILFALFYLPYYCLCG
jgi:hypothetical protein